MIPGVPEFGGGGVKLYRNKVHPEHVGTFWQLKDRFFAKNIVVGEKWGGWKTVREDRQYEPGDWVGKVLTQPLLNLLFVRSDDFTKYWEVIAE